MPSPSNAAAQATRSGAGADRNTSTSGARPCTTASTHRANAVSTGSFAASDRRLGQLDGALQLSALYLEQGVLAQHVRTRSKRSRRFEPRCRSLVIAREHCDARALVQGAVARAARPDGFGASQRRVGLCARLPQPVQIAQRPGRVDPRVDLVDGVPRAAQLDRALQLDEPALGLTQRDPRLPELGRVARLFG